MHIPNHSVIQSVLIVAFHAYGLFILLPTLFTARQVGALSVSPIETSTGTSRRLVDDDHHKRYDRPTIQRRDVLDCLRGSVFASIFLGSTLPPAVCHALTPIEAQQKYDTYATSYDQIDGGIASELFGIDAARKFIIQKARGKVLEVGVGTGLNLQYYNTGGDQVTSLDVVDISDGMLQEAVKKVSTLSNMHNIPINFIKADMTAQLVQKLGMESYDTIVDTFSMCVLGDVGAQQSLDQMSRVVRRDGGQVLLLENSRSSNIFLGRYQDATAETAANVGGRGCIYNQNIRQLIQSNKRLQIVDETEFAAGLFRSFRCTRTI